MKLLNTSRTGMLTAIASIGLLFSSCDSVIYDDQGDCTVHYRLHFSYTKNVLNTDAFGSQITDVNVALYNEAGTMVFTKTEHRSLTPDNTYYMDVEVNPGRYNIIAWCEGQSVTGQAASFTLEEQATGDAITASGARLQLAGADGERYFSSDINPLYYGAMQNVEFVDSYGVINVGPIDLIKDTNHITVQLQNMNGMSIDPNLLSFELSARNSFLNWENRPVGDLEFDYRPWSVESTFTSGDIAPTSRIGDGDVPSGVQVEFTTGRIMDGIEQRLTVRKADTGVEILSIPMVQYLLLVRSKYQQATSNQDYLDHVDDYTMVFFIDEAYVWNKSRIYINNWRVVPPQTGGIQGSEE